MDRSAILSHVHSSLYDIPLHVRARHCGQSVLFPRTFKIIFVHRNNCAKRLHFSACGSYMYTYMYGYVHVHVRHIKL